jgi:hypothetical protein
MKAQVIGLACLSFWEAVASDRQAFASGGAIRHQTMTSLVRRPDIDEHRRRRREEHSSILMNGCFIVMAYAPYHAGGLSSSGKWTGYGKRQ